MITVCYYSLDYITVYHILATCFLPPSTSFPDRRDPGAPVVAARRLGRGGSRGWHPLPDAAAVCPLQEDRRRQ